MKNTPLSSVTSTTLSPMTTSTQSILAPSRSPLLNSANVFSETECWYTDYINGTVIPLPNFDMYTYMGMAYVNLVKCYHWRWSDTANDYIEELWETADDERDPVRMDVIDNHMGTEDTYDYTEFDQCANEDEDLFVIPDLILDVCTQTM